MGKIKNKRKGRYSKKELLIEENKFKEIIYQDEYKEMFEPKSSLEGHWITKILEGRDLYGRTLKRRTN